MRKFENENKNEITAEDISDVMIFPCLLVIPKMLSKEEFLTLLEIKPKNSEDSTQ